LLALLQRVVCEQPSRASMTLDKDSQLIKLEFSEDALAPEIAGIVDLGNGKFQLNGSLVDFLRTSGLHQKCSCDITGLTPTFDVTQQKPQGMDWVIDRKKHPHLYHLDPPIFTAGSVKFDGSASTSKIWVMAGSKRAGDEHWSHSVFKQKVSLYFREAILRAQLGFGAFNAAYLTNAQSLSVSAVTASARAPVASGTLVYGLSGIGAACSFNNFGLFLLHLRWVLMEQKCLHRVIIVLDQYGQKVSDVTADMVLQLGGILSAVQSWSESDDGQVVEVMRGIGALSRAMAAVDAEKLTGLAFTAGSLNWSVGLGCSASVASGIPHTMSMFPHVNHGNVKVSSVRTFSPFGVTASDGATCATGPVTFLQNDWFESLDFKRIQVYQKGLQSHLYRFDRRWHQFTEDEFPNRRSLQDELIRFADAVAEGYDNLAHGMMTVRVEVLSQGLELQSQDFDAAVFEKRLADFYAERLKALVYMVAGPSHVRVVHYRDSSHLFALFSLKLLWWTVKMDILRGYFSGNPHTTVTKKARQSALALCGLQLRLLLTGTCHATNSNHSKLIAEAAARGRVCGFDDPRLFPNSTELLEKIRRSFLTVLKLTSIGLRA
jgi:hypothetical protein